MRVPGFRSGKVPPEVVLQQVGREAVLDEAVRRGAARLVRGGASPTRASPTVGDPQLDLTTCPSKGSPLAFTIEVGVRPAGQARRLQGRSRSGAASPRSTPRRSQAELERLRESLASLETVERAGRRGRLRGHRLRRLASTASRSRAARAAATCVELGSGRLIPGFEEQLDGRLAPATSATVEVTFPDDYPAEHLAGKDAVVRRRGQGGQGEAPAGAGRRLRGRGGRLRLARRAAHRASSRASREAEERDDRGGVPRGGRRRRRRAGAGRGPGGARPRRRRTRCGTAPRTGSQRRASTPQQYLADDRQDRGGARRRGRARRRDAR